MPRVKTESLQSGMVVAGDVKNLHQMLLIPAGATLTDRQINILQAWGISEVEVQAAGGESSENASLSPHSPQEIAELTAEIKQRFWQPNENHPVNAEILRLMLERRCRGSSSG